MTFPYSDRLMDNAVDNVMPVVDETYNMYLLRRQTRWLVDLIHSDGQTGPSGPPVGFLRPLSSSLTHSTGLLTPASITNKCTNVENCTDTWEKTYNALVRKSDRKGHLRNVSIYGRNFFGLFDEHFHCTAYEMSFKRWLSYKEYRPFHIFPVFAWIYWERQLKILSNYRCLCI
jgi:hypothetical protein